MGLNAKRFLPDQEAEKLFPIRGQTILVKGEAAIARTFTDFEEGDELVSLISWCQNQMEKKSEVKL